LLQITRQGIRAAVESYSLKQLEALEDYGFVRKVPPRDAARAMQEFGRWLETGEARVAPAELRATIERYNEDDCRRLPARCATGCVTSEETRRSKRHRAHQNAIRCR